MNRTAGWLRRFTQSSPTAPEHVTNDQILLLLDGEVADSERRRIQRHLTDCWNCRFRCEEMQSAIHHMVECRNLVVDYRLKTEPPSSRALLAARLQEQRELVAAPSHSATMWFAKYRYAVLAAGACVALLLPTAVLLRRTRPQPWIASSPASAQETLDRAISLEKAEVVAAGQVRHRSLLLRVRNVSKAIEMAPRKIDVWDDPERHRSALVDTRGEGTLDESQAGKTGRRASDTANESDMGSGSRSGGSFPSRALPVGFETLRVAEFSKLVTDPSRLSIASDKTHQTLLYRSQQSPVAEKDSPRILLARLDLRSVDLHPVAEQLAIADGGSTWEFRLSEEADVAVSVASVPPGVFDGRVSPAPAVASGEPAAASLEEIVDVLTVLDGAGALTQQDVQLQKSADGKLQVGGVVQDDVRRQALLQLLQPDSGRNLTVRIATLAEQPRQPRKAASLLVVEGGAENSGADAILTDYLTNTLRLPAAEVEQKRVEIENRLLALSGDAESQAEALHEVLSLVPQTKMSSTPFQVRREWESLVQHHASALEQDLAEIGKTLRPLSANLNAPACAAQSHNAQADLTELLSSTRRISTNVSNFVALPAAGAQNGVLTSSFGCLLESTEQRASRLITPPPES